MKATRGATRVIYDWDELRTSAVAWHVNPNELSNSALYDRCFGWLSAEERTHYMNRRTDETRHEYLTTRALCRATLSRYTGVNPSDWVFATTVTGKPRIAQPAKFKSVRFNLTHTAGLVVFLLSRAGEVGVDAEETSRTVDVAQVARHFLSTRERARLGGLPDELRLKLFFEQWVLREAYFKGVGKGVASAPERFAIEIGKNGQPAQIRDWRLYLFRPNAKHVAGAAVRQPRGSPPVRVRWSKAKNLA